MNRLARNLGFPPLRTRLLALGLILLTPLTSLSADDPQTETLSGQVKKLSQVLQDRQITVDPTLLDDQVVVESSDGTITPILPNAASKAFYLDERLRNRPAELTAWHHQGLPFLEIVSFRVEKDGKMRTPEYFCEVCTISVRYPQKCPCCQGPMELRYQPAPSR